MKQLKNNYLLILLFVCTVLASCRKTDDTPYVATFINSGLLILNQGGFNGNNSTLTGYDFTNKTTVADVFNALNGTGLGDTGNDMGTYGAKTYIVVNVSSNVFVINKRTGKLISKIPFFTGTTARQPRSIVFNGSRAFVSAYDGSVAVIDTASLTITKSITVGSSPEQMAIANGKLYVANSGGLNYPNYSNTVSVIDLNTLAVTKTITVGLNPVSVVADAYGLVYVQANGDYNTVTPSFTVIDASTDVVKTKTDSFNGSNMVIQGDNIYFTTTDKKIKVYNVKTQAVASANFITDGTTAKIPYSLAVSPTTGEVFLGDAIDYSSNGNVYAYDKTGKLEYTIKAGINPGKMIFVNN